MNVHLFGPVMRSVTGSFVLILGVKTILRMVKCPRFPFPHWDLDFQAVSLFRIISYSFRVRTFIYGTIQHHPAPFPTSHPQNIQGTRSKWWWPVPLLRASCRPLCRCQHPCPGGNGWRPEMEDPMDGWFHGKSWKIMENPHGNGLDWFRLNPQFQESPIRKTIQPTSRWKILEDEFEDKLDYFFGRCVQDHWDLAQTCDSKSWIRSVPHRWILQIPLQTTNSEEPGRSIMTYHEHIKFNKPTEGADEGW